ncbi:hypothetical protein OG440_35465 [Streptomyces sp. NBC_00637]|uniref:hypothetical protein n=1 Tax=Streptomyces sp. NBC_00637 TaxID=2903667 RepID=UPI0032524D32
MSTGSAPAARVATTAPTFRHGWHKLLIAFILLGRVTRIPAAMDATTGATPSGWWNVVWEVLALGLAAFAVSEWEILQAARWRMSVTQWICLVLFHVGLLGFLAAQVLQLL